MPPARKATATKKAPAERAKAPAKKTTAAAKKTAPAKPPKVPEPPVRLGVRGRKLWTELHAANAKRDPASDGLIVEACRLTDRLDRLDALLSGSHDEWLRFTLPEDSSELVLRVDALLAEARQHATALRGLLAPLTKAAAPAENKPEASLADQLAARRAARIATPAHP